MAGLLNWLGGVADAFIPGDQSSWHKDDKKKQQPAPAQAPRPAPRPAPPRPAPPSFGQRVGGFLTGIPNIKFDGLTQARDLLSGKTYEDGVAKAAGQTPTPSNPVTLGDTARQIPVLKQAIDFGKRRAANPKQGIIEGEKDLIGNSFKTGVHYAPYVIPELGIMRAAPEAALATRVAAKAANNFIPAAGLTAADQFVSEGNRNAGDITKKSLEAGAINTVISELPIIRNALKNRGGATAAEEAPIKLLTQTDLPAPKVEAPKIEAPNPLQIEAQKVIDDTKKYHPEFNSKIDNIAKSLGEQGYTGPPKEAARVAEKAAADYGGDIGQVRDIVRGTVHLSDPNNLDNHLAEIAKNYEITRVKNGLNAAGYKDVKVNVRLPNGREGEVLLASPEMLAAKHELGGHALYKEARTTVDAKRFAELEAQMNKLYSDADAAAAKRLASSADSSVPSTNALAGGNGAPVATTEPVTSLPSEATLTSTPSTSKNLSDPIIESPSTPTIPQTVEAGNPQVVGNKFTQTVKDSPEVSPEVSAMVSGQHTVRNTNELVANVQAQIKNEGVEPALNRTLQELSVPAGQTSDETLARAIELAKHYDSLGTEAGQDMAASLYDQVSEHGVGKGQGSQILSMLARRSPAGLRNKAFRDLKKAGVEITPEIKKEIQTQIDAIRGMEDGPARDFAIAIMQKSVAKHMPQGVGDNAVSVWKAGLLSGTKTQGGNFISNATFGALKKASDLPANVADRIAALRTGERTQALTLRGMGSGAKEGLKNAKTTLKTGIDIRDLTDKYEQHGEINFGNKIVQKVLGDPANLVFRGMNAADQPWYYSALKNSMYDQAKADGITAGLRGSALRKHMEELVANPTEKMMVRANSEAAKAVLGYDTFASKAIRGIHSAIDKLPDSSRAGKQSAHAVVDILAPFTKVPSAFLSRTVDFTPLGVGKEVFSQIAKKNFDQRALSQAIGEGATGTGIIALGIALAHSDMLSGDYPKDAKEQQRWKAQGITQNSVKLGDKWVSLNYLGPVGLLFNAGKKMVDAEKEGAEGGGKVAAALGGIGQGLMGQSFLQGFSGFSDAIKDPERNAASFIRSEIGSLIPSWSNDIANTLDPMQRQTNSAIDAAKQRIPGLRNTLAEKKDAFGDPLAQPSGSGLTTAVNPFKPSDIKSSPLLSELDRLKGTSKDNFVFPTPDKTLSVGNETIKMSAEEQDKYNTAVGQQTKETWNNIIASPEYQNLNDTQKANALREAASDIQALNKKAMLSIMGRGDAADKVKLSGQQESLAAGTMGADGYVAKAMGKDNPAQTYQQKLAKYKADKSAGKLSAYEDWKALNELGKLKITSQYSKDVQNLYSMGKKERAAFLAAHPEQVGLMDQVAKMSAELKGHNFAATDKIAGSGKKGRKGKGRGRKGTGAGSLSKLSSTSKAVRSAGSKLGGKSGGSSSKVAKAKVKKAGAPKTVGITTRKELA